MIDEFEEMGHRNIGMNIGGPFRGHSSAMLLLLFRTPGLTTSGLGHLCFIK